MAERSLNERFIDLEERMISVAALTKYGTANDLKFYIFDYDPKDELYVRKEVIKLKTRNPEIIEFDLYEIMMEIIKNEDYLNDIIRMEKDYQRDLLLTQIFQPLLAVEESHNQVIEIFKQRAKDDGTKIVLLTGIGKAYPIIRSHTILNNLQSVFKKNPVVMMYPGRYETKKSMILKLFDRLDDDHYYRAFPLVERRGGSKW
jgi:hypothetical protein